MSKQNGLREAEFYWMDKYVSLQERATKHSRECIHAMHLLPCFCGADQAAAELDDKQVTIEELTVACRKQRERGEKSEVALDKARRVIDNDLQWFVKYTEKHPDNSANERYLDCRKWWEAHPEPEAEK